MHGDPWQIYFPGTTVPVHIDDQRPVAVHSNKASRRISGGHISLYKAASSTPFSLGFDVNNDGTLQTPLGAIKKMGN